MAPQLTDIKNAENNTDVKALQLLISNIEKEYGKGSVSFAGADNAIQMDRIGTGSISLDGVTGGGYPRGRITEIYGPESSGKTTLTLHAIAEAQKNGGICAFIDAEHALDVNYAKSLGVNLDNLLISQPDDAEQALNVLSLLTQSGLFTLIVVDSVAALTPRAEIEGEVGDSHMGLLARLMGQTLRKITGNALKTNTSIIFINQIRMKIGVMFGNPEITTGGNALKFFSSIRLDIRQTTKNKIDEEIVSGTVRVKAVKNKTATPYKQCEFDIVFGKGINFTSDLLKMASDLGIVEKSGAWYSYAGERIGQGTDKSIDFLDKNISIRDQITKALQTKIAEKVQ